MYAREAELQLIAAEVLSPRIDGSTDLLSMLKHEVDHIAQSSSVGDAKML